MSIIIANTSINQFWKLKMQHCFTFFTEFCSIWHKNFERIWHILASGDFFNAELTLIHKSILILTHEIPHLLISCDIWLLETTEELEKKWWSSYCWESIQRYKLSTIRVLPVFVQRIWVTITKQDKQKDIVCSVVFNVSNYNNCVYWNKPKTLKKL